MNALDRAGRAFEKAGRKSLREQVAWNAAHYERGRDHPYIHGLPFRPENPGELKLTWGLICDLKDRLRAWRENRGAWWWKYTPNEHFQIRAALAGEGFNLKVLRKAQARRIRERVMPAPILRMIGLEKVG